MNNIFETTVIVSAITNYTSENLLQRDVSTLLSKEQSLPRYDIHNAEFTVDALTLILATPVGATIKTCGLSDEPQSYWRTYRIN